MLDFTVCIHTQQMSAPPPSVIPRKPSGVKVMIAPGEQRPPGGVSVYRNSSKGMLIWLTCMFEHVLSVYFYHLWTLLLCTTNLTQQVWCFVYMSKFALMVLLLLCSENGASKSIHTSLMNAENEVVCTRINH